MRGIKRLADIAELLAAAKEIIARRKEIAVLKARWESGDESARKQYFIAALGGRERRRRLGVTSEQMQRWRETANRAMEAYLKNGRKAPGGK